MVELARDQRRVVDDRDPAKRPLYYMTPGRLIGVYEGGVDGQKTLGQVALSLSRSAKTLTMLRPDETATTAESLAARPSKAMPASSARGR